MCYNGRMEEKVGAGNNVGLKVVLGVLVSVIIVLGVAVIMAKLNGTMLFGDVGDFDPKDGINTILLTEEIDEKLDTDPNYGYEQASEDYREAMSSGDNTTRLSAAFAYAQYDYSVYQNADRAIAILEEVKDLADTDYLKYIYCGYLLKFYQDAGYEEKANNIITMMNELSPKPVFNETEDV